MSPSHTTACVAGVDSSTQSCKVVTVDPATGRVLSLDQAPHPDGTEVDPARWWDALQQVASEVPSASAASVAGQQHGLVTVDADGRTVRPALLWNDVRSAPQATALTGRLGRQAWVEAVGSVPIPSLTVTKLAWLREQEPELAARVDRVMLPHDWLTWRLLGAEDNPTTDRSDASGTGYWSSATGEYRRDLVELAFGRQVGLPHVLGPAQEAGRTARGTIIGPGLGDNAAAALGLGLRPGETVVSLGTSGAVFASADGATPDPSGELNLFADGQGRLLPLSCTMNAARVLGAIATALGTDLAGMERLESQAPLDADGMILLPYLDGERTPSLPGAAGSLHGLRRSTMTPEHLARAGVLGMLCGLADALDAVRRSAVPVEQVLLIGGAAQSPAVRTAAPEIFGVPVVVPEPGEYVALGAARQAAWVESGADEPPVWERRVVAEIAPSGEGWGAQVRERYAAYRHQMYPQV